MTVFEFLSVAISIILGLGLAKILSGLSSLARSWKRVKPYWVHLAWTFLILVLHIQLWWSYWDFSNDRTWTLASFATILVLPGFAYFLADLITPDSAPGAAIDLRAHFAEVRVPFFVALALFWAYAMVYRTLVFGDPLLEPRRVAQALIVIAAVAGSVKDTPRSQSAVLVISLLSWVSLLWFRLQLGATMD